MSPRRTRAAKTRQSEEQQEEVEKDAVSDHAPPPMTPKNMRVVELREALMARGLSAKGLKQELVLRLEEALDDHQPEEGPAEPVVPAEPAVSAEPTNAAVVEDQAEEHPTPSSPTKRHKSRHQLKALPEQEEPAKAEEHPESVVVPTATPVLSEPSAPADAPTTTLVPSESLSAPADEPTTAHPPPSSAPTEQWLHIKNLRRPFTLAAIRDLLGQFGPIADFWLDPLKTQCLVRYCTLDAHTDCIHKLSGLKWPPEIGNVLDVQVISEDAKQRIVVSEPRRPVDQLSPSPREAEPPSLDELFLKTTTLPQLYYLPACTDLE